MADLLEIPGTRSATCSRRALSRLCAGELAPAEESQVREHVKQCPDCSAELSRLQGEAASFPAEVPFDDFARAVLAKAERPKRKAISGPVGLALAAGILLIVLAGPLTFLSQHSRNALKGGDAVLELFVGGTGQAPRLATDGEALAPGERVRVGYQAPRHRHLLVLSVDESGTATALYPESGASLPVERAPGTHLMPDSLELTGKGYERIVAVFSDQPIDVAQALAAASREFSRAGSLQRMHELRLSVKSEESAVTVKKSGEQ